MPEQQTSAAAQATETIEPSDFDALLNKEFRPKTEEAKTAVQQAVGTLAQPSARPTSSRMTSSPPCRP